MVCLVDDDSSVRKSLARLLESTGYQVNAFSKPQAFLDHLAQHSVSLVVLDIWMEQMSGMELLAQLRARSPRTRAIYVTGDEDPSAEAMVMRAGAFAFFIKPFDNAGFLATVREAFDAESREKGITSVPQPNATSISGSKMRFRM